MKNNTHKRIQWSQSIIDSGQNQLKYSYQLQQGDKTHHTKHTTTHRKVTLMPKHPSLQNKTTDVVIHQHSRKLLKMDILMSETCWAHNKWNKIASDIKLVFHSSTKANLRFKRKMVLPKGWYPLSEQKEWSYYQSVLSFSKLIYLWVFFLIFNFLKWARL